MYIIETGNENPILRKTIHPVTEFNEELEKIVDEMEATMLAPDPKTEVKGVGLAGNQVGFDKRIILITFNVGTRKEQKTVTMINPEIIELSQKEIWMEEGCLSIPGVFAKVLRPAKVKVRWQNVQGNWCEKKLDKWDARIFLHEYDHLEGKLFTDYPIKNSRDERHQAL